MKTTLLLAIVMGPAVAAHCVQPNLVSTTPPGGQRGTELEVTFRGDRLEDAQDIFFHHPGIHLVKIEEATANAVRARLKIDPDCRLGEHAVRVRTASGISPLRMFHVGAYPAVEEKEPNNEAAKPQPVALGSTVTGSLGSEDVDLFSVEARQGQRITVEVEGARLGRTMLDPRIAILNDAGQPLTAADDNALLTQDPYASIIAPADGRYLVEVRDSAYAGSGHVYRLHVGSFTRPAAVYPPGGQTGDTVEVRFIGDPMGEFVQKVKLPAAPDPKFGVIAERDGLTPSPNWIRVSPFPNVLETEPNDAPEKASGSPLELPLAFNGVLNRKGDADWFRFKARKDQQLEVTVYARRLGSPVDSLLQICDAQGKSLASNDDAGGPDSSQRWRVPADGEYLVKINDHLNRGGDTFTYRVEVQESRPAVTLYVPDAGRYDYETRKSIVVPRGNRFAFLMNATRENFTGDLKLLFDGLPEGITVEAGTLASGQNSLPVVFEAPADAPIAGRLLEPVARPVEAMAPLQSTFRHRVEWVRIQNNTVYVQSDVHQMAAAIVEPVPFRIRLAEPDAPLVQNGALDLEVVAERDAGYDEPITLKMLLNPPGTSALPEMTIPPGTNRISYRLDANANAQTGRCHTAVIATAKLKDGNPWISSQLVALDVAPSYLTGSIKLTSVERGKSVRLVCEVEHRNPFEGKAVVKLLGLPSNTTAEPVEITKDDKQVVFEVKTTEKTQAGMHRNLFCAATITQGSTTVEQSLARGGVLRVDAPRVKVATAKPVAAVAAPSGQTPTSAK